MKKEKYLYYLLIIFLILLYCIVGTLEYQIAVQEEAWKESTQALELEQQKIQLDILEVREQILKADEQIRAHNLLIWDIRNRLHLDLELELEGER